MKERQRKKVCLYVALLSFLVGKRNLVEFNRKKKKKSNGQVWNYLIWNLYFYFEMWFNYFDFEKMNVLIDNTFNDDSAFE